MANLERQRQQETLSLRASSENVQREMQGHCTNLQAQLDAFQVCICSPFVLGLRPKTCTTLHSSFRCSADGLVVMLASCGLALCPCKLTNANGLDIKQARVVHETCPHTALYCCLLGMFELVCSKTGRSSHLLLARSLLVLISLHLVGGSKPRNMTLSGQKSYHAWWKRVQFLSPLAQFTQSDTAPVLPLHVVLHGIHNTLGQ